MGYRANVITRHREYGSQTFSNYQAFQKFLRLESDKLDIIGEWELETYYVEAEQLEKYIASLPDNDEMSNYEGMTNRELANALRGAIEESPDRDVTWEWF